MFRNTATTVFRNTSRFQIGAAATAATSAALYLDHQQKHSTSSPGKVSCEKSKTYKTTLGSPVKTSAEVPKNKDLRVISLEELREHTDPDNGLWVSFKGHVYDVSHFPKIHPGGPGRIEMAAGTDLQPYFDVYHLHPDVSGFLDRTCLIGRLSKKDAKKSEKETVFANPYAEDPVTDLRDPFGGAPKWSNLMYKGHLDNFYTPNRDFYVRNHFPIPQWDDVEQDYSFDLVLPSLSEEDDEEEENERTFTLQDLRDNLQEHTVSSVMVCGGPAIYPRYLHRTDDRENWEVKHFKRNQANNNFWGGHGKWTGYKLRDLLNLQGIDVDAIALGEKPLPDKYLKLTGHDADETGAPFGVTIPLEKVVDPFGDVLLATKLNDEPLTPDHGYPLRLLVPGFAGVRNCKWIAKIEFSDDLHECHVDTHTDEVIYPPDMTFEDNAARTDVEMDEKLKHYWETNKIWRVMEMPTMSFVASPEPDEQFSAKQLSSGEGVIVRGYAFDGSGHRMARVDVSADGGKSYSPADVDDHEMEKVHRRNHHWSWYSWEKKIRMEDLDEEAQQKLAKGEPVQLMIAARAMADNGNVQPSREAAPSLYNYVGNINNAQTHTPVTILPAKKC
uniref:Cytochrome b5 heme-binding domain-containing protein n=1 Tax=Pseudictyota dubia TaxID=2749911 RepID=A0A7R9YYB9_9STRA|mmetsp:Transcript_12278/g.23172  ORF Transcript_12278/g.23172 Transcript_12278/m.23172 type:complete len:613 (+) Transcript_12278:156-1994(+)|eukprot:CAMPEP_0197454132 /NCGR_PEP_ID=MMETSP1175-20131217/37005_1 /TAXON_ID=1003142 /ORGANISM="Triceratium dubium, Strain CCMP147" /LENGTH=612 /DNA_ID=CAMNT_0042987625 /DNA_START=155 /DNA_END=1993 /DNA_ORIENTATION=+